MAVAGHQNAWTPTADCSLGICSHYCPRWCYPPVSPPPPFTIYKGHHNASPPTDITPFLTAVLVVLISAIIVLMCFTFIFIVCRRAPRQPNPDDALNDAAAYPDNVLNDAAPSTTNSSAGGLVESQINSLPVGNYKRSEVYAHCSDCSICLSDFEEDEAIRWLPRCSHAFHVHCIDAWLNSHSTCPLCRSTLD